MSFSWGGEHFGTAKIHTEWIATTPKTAELMRDRVEYQKRQKIQISHIQDGHCVSAVLTSPNICRAIFDFLTPSPSAICARVCQAWVVPWTQFCRALNMPDNRISSRYICSSAPLLKWARKLNFQWDEWACMWMAVTGRLDCLRYAHEHGCPWNLMASALAAENGHLDCLRYLHENGCFWDSDICTATAKNGHLECLKYLHENGGKWDKYTCRNAAWHDHLDCLRYAHSHGCFWDNCDGCDKATLDGHSR